MSDQDQPETFLWKGQLRYRCNRFWESGAPCQWNTYDIEEWKRHVSQSHGRAVEEPKRARRQVSSVLVNEQGKPLETEIDPQFKNVRFKQK